MLPRALLITVTWTLALLAAGGPAHAQNPFSFFDLFRPRPQYYEPQTVPRRNPYQQQQQQRRKAAPRTVIVQDTAKPKVDPGTFVVVMGDSLSENLARGLDETFADKPDVAIVDKTKGDSGIVRSDYFDWPKAVTELLAGKEKVTVGVMLVGVNDRQAIRDNNESHEPGSAKWEAIYGSRIEAIVKAFAEKRIPLVWVGLPPMKNDKISADVSQINAFVRDKVQQGGAAFVDIWEAFADDDNRYSAYGPGLSGQNTKLRAADGLHFTKAGARKLAHFVEVEIKRLVDTAPPTVVALPSAQPSNQELDLSIPGNLERMIDQAIKPVPELQGVVGLTAKPLAGPIVTLTRQDSTPGAQLVAKPSGSASGDASRLIERVFNDGRAPEPRAGRADDFRWPRQ